MAELEFKSEKAKKFFKELGENIDDVVKTKKAYKDAISSFVFQDINDHFENKKGSKGTWQKWSKAYTAHMNKIGKGGNKILRDTGVLQRSVMSAKNDKPGIMEWINIANYSRKHDEGLDGMPKRDFMWLSNRALGKINSLSLQWMVVGKKAK